MHANRFVQHTKIRVIVLGCGLLGATACDRLTGASVTNTIAHAAATEACTMALADQPEAAPIDRTIRRYQLSYSNHPDKEQSLEKLGWAYVDKAMRQFDPGYYTLAEQTALCLHSLKPDSQAALFLQGHVAHQLHRFQAAEQIARQLIYQRAQWFDYALLGDALMEQGRLTAAVTAYQQMLDQNPGAQTYNRVAHLRWLTGDIEGAEQMLQLSLQAQGQRVDLSTAWAATRLADIEFYQGRLDASLQRLNALLEHQPEYAPALLLRGKIHLAKNNIPLAVQSLRQAQDINPLPDYRWGLIEALALMHSDDWRQVEHRLLATGARDDRRTFALYLASSRLHHSAKALSLADQELQLRQDALTLDAYAWSLFANKLHAQALDYAKRALAVGTPSARLMYHAGLIAIANGQNDEGKRLLHQAKRVEHTLWPSERRQLNQFL